MQHVPSTCGVVAMQGPTFHIHSILYSPFMFNVMGWIYKTFPIVPIFTRPSNWMKANSRAVFDTRKKWKEFFFRQNLPQVNFATPGLIGESGEN